jgi:hypothetical protein
MMMVQAKYCFSFGADCMKTPRLMIFIVLLFVGLDTRGDIDVAGANRFDFDYLVIA